MPDGRRLVWAPAASADLSNIWRFYAEAASPDTADKMLHEIRDAVVAFDPLKTPGRPRDELLPGLRSILKRRHVVFFRLGDDRIEVVRVLHERQDAPSTLGAEWD